MGREVMANRPDIIIKNKRYKTCILICHFSSSQKCHVKKAGKKIKYKSLSLEI
jgi:hypothetical protein